ncbi:hypothetical protein DPX16_10765 [Anabarilius grahami]|uniref:Uncharacterized protein n=1 Tax=Anabarilius grahami TaxID=495550 RepID=A0A3N0Z7R4_ANAGA|nr:hypothetical protein DPX16_10765 [Anabarilius grahami]
MQRLRRAETVACKVVTSWVAQGCNGYQRPGIIQPRKQGKRRQSRDPRTRNLLYNNFTPNGQSMRRLRHAETVACKVVTSWVAQGCNGYQRPGIIQPRKQGKRRQSRDPRTRVRQTENTTPGQPTTN